MFKTKITNWGDSPVYHVGPFTCSTQGVRNTELLAATTNLFAHSDDLRAELYHLYWLLRPLEQAGTLKVPGLATLDRTREILDKSSSTVFSAPELHPSEGTPTMPRWVSIAEEGQPPATKENPYPTHWVRTEYVPPATMTSTKRQCRILLGELRLFGRDPNRPNWMDPSSHQPIENDSWVVTHWLQGDLQTLPGWPEGGQ